MCLCLFIYKYYSSFKVYWVIYFYDLIKRKPCNYLKNCSWAEPSYQLVCPHVKVSPKHAVIWLTSPRCTSGLKLKSVLMALERHLLFICDHIVINQTYPLCLSLCCYSICWHMWALPPMGWLWSSLVSDFTQYLNKPTLGPAAGRLPGSYSWTSFILWTFGF